MLSCVLPWLKGCSLQALMLIVSETHTRTPVNSSVLIHFVIRVAAHPTDPGHRSSPDATEQLYSTEEDVQALLDEITQRVSIIVSSYSGIDESKVTVVAVPESPLRDQHFFGLAAQIYILSKSMGVPYTINLSPMGPTFKTFSGSTITDARSAMANLFGNHRAFVKVIQSSKKEEHQEEESSDHLAYLMALLVQSDEATVLEEEDILELMRDHGCLRDVALHLSTHQTN